MHQSATTNAVRNPSKVALACLFAAYAMSACSSSESPVAPAVASGGTGLGGNTQTQNGGATQAQNGGATQTQTGGATQAQNGGSTQTGTGGATQTQTGGATQTQTGGATQTQTGGATSAGGATGTGGATDVGGSSSTGGATDAGGTTGTGGAASAGGTTSTAGAGGAVACLPVTKALISDFTYTAGGSTSTSAAGFGDYTTTFSGGTFIYPESATALKSDITQSNWHISGNVTDYAGFSFFYAFGCTKIDASAYKGISFVISGTINTGVAASANTLTLVVGTAADDITAVWLNANKAAGAADVANFGRCTPASATNKYDGTCASPQKTGIPVTTTPTTITVLWADLTGGKPDASVTASELVSIAWILPNPTGVGTTSVVPYPVDIVVDDIQFVQ